MANWTTYHWHMFAPHSGLNKPTWGKSPNFRGQTIWSKLATKYLTDIMCSVCIYLAIAAVVLAMTLAAPARADPSSNNQSPSQLCHDADYADLHPTICGDSPFSQGPSGHGGNHGGGLLGGLLHGLTGGLL